MKGSRHSDTVSFVTISATVSPSSSLTLKSGRGAACLSNTVSLGFWHDYICLEQTPSTKTLHNLYSMLVLKLLAPELSQVSVLVTLSMLAIVLTEM